MNKSPILQINIEHMFLETTNHDTRKSCRYRPFFRCIGRFSCIEFRFINILNVNKSRQNHVTTYNPQKTQWSRSRNGMHILQTFHGIRRTLLLQLLWCLSLSRNALHSLRIPRKKWHTRFVISWKIALQTYWQIVFHGYERISP